jgi:hypothetical protein
VGAIMDKLTRARIAFGVVLFLIGGFLFLTNASLAQEEYFDEAGYVVKGKFLRFFKEHGGLLVFGYPISPAVTDRDYSFQYFQNGRLEMDAEGTINLSLLPNELSQRRTNAIPESETPAGGRYFPTTGHSLERAFLDFYLEHGGHDLFGYPITELINENDRLVQYFERAVFEWHPQLPNGQRVQLRRIGEIYLQTDGLDMAAYYVDDTDYPITRIDVSACVLEPMVGQEDEMQTIYVHAYDQLGKPVESVVVQAFILWPNVNNEIQLLPTQSTDEHGAVVISFPVTALSEVAPLSVGDTVPIKIQANLDPLGDQTATAFRVWW